MPRQTYQSRCHSPVLDRIRDRVKQGPLAPHLEAYEQKLKDQGFAIFTGHLRLRLLADLGDWMKDRGLALEQLDLLLIDEYLRYRHQKLRPRLDHVIGLRRLLELIQPEPPIPPLGDSCRVREFAQYLQQERGLAEATICTYVATAREFVTECRAQDRADFDFLQATDVTNFVQRKASRVGSARAKHVVTSLRSFLRFLLQRGALHRDLAACAPTVAGWSLSALPRFISPQDVQKVIDSCDCARPGGLRDRALLLLLARLGLRSGEIMRLTLDDVDWESGVLTIRGKNRTPAQLPLLTEVGEALAQYVQQARPRCASRRIFVRFRAPLGDFASGTMVCCIVARSLRRAGVASEHKGGHLFRHSLATQMINSGASLGEIGEVLRHLRLRTTSIYAKVDLASLRTVAPRWPGGPR
ncbi:MAG: tyrosine-type recombinase/integrase [Terriglobia bacterium]